jgi:transcription factor C subunit 3
LDQLLAQYDVVETVPTAPTWDFVWNAVVEEGREKRMLRQPFSKAVEEITEEGQPEAISLAESALKVITACPEKKENSLISRHVDGSGNAKRAL